MEVVAVFATFEGLRIPASKTSFENAQAQRSNGCRVFGGVRTWLRLSPRAFVMCAAHALPTICAHPKAPMPADAIIRLAKGHIKGMSPFRGRLSSPHKPAFPHRARSSHQHPSRAARHSFCLWRSLVGIVAFSKKWQFLREAAMNDAIMNI